MVELNQRKNTGVVVHVIDLTHGVRVCFDQTLSPIRFDNESNAIF